MLDLDSSISSTDEADQVRDALCTRVRDALAARTNGTPRVVRVQVDLPRPVAPLAWLRAQGDGAAAYWSARNDAAAVATVGAADVVASTERPLDNEPLRRELGRRLRRTEAPVRYYGGLRFDATYPRAENGIEAPWTAFGTYRFVLPRFELHTREAGAALACNLVLPRDAERVDALTQQVRALTFPTEEASLRPSLPAPLGRTDVPDREGWTEMVRWALRSINDRSLDKVVLARRVALDLGTGLDPFLVLQHLQRATPRCFHFAVRPAEGGAAFIGASPERLLRREGTRVQSEAVAGTRPRGETPEADAALRDELLRSPKERREHAFVQEAIRERLEALCTAVDAPEAPSDLALARGRHLHAPLTGTLRAETTTLDLLEALHPTPAVGGVPTDEALAAIRAQEPFDRGWYAGPVGWIGADAAEFAVAIRSGLVQSSRLALFSGAGIVDGSVPEQEWDEIEQKIGDFASVLGLNGHAGDGRDANSAPQS
jgi:menaquinone-specific isochorismate synthase